MELPSKHRTVPITETITTIAGYPDKLKLFKIPASSYWWVRYYTRGRILKKSTKTEGKKEAIEFAKNFFSEILMRERMHLPLGSSPTFERCADDLIAEQEQKIERGELNPKQNTNDRSILKSIKNHFKGMDVRSITYKHIETYLSTLSKKRLHEGTENERSVSSSTLKKHSNLISKILKYAQREGVVDRIPTMPTVSIKDSPRGWFSHDEYLALREVLATISQDAVKVRNLVIDDEMRLLTTFMVNTFLRPSDLKNLRHRNIEIVSKDQTYLRITTEGSKTENTPVVSMEDAVGIYKDIKQFHEGCKKNDFVFFPKIENRDFAMETMRRQFDKILQVADLKHSPSGEPRTLYSLRHTAIMFRLTKGDQIDLLTLARNARTSVEMIERFYARHLTAEMNVDKIQSTKKTPTNTRKRTATSQKSVRNPAK
jgi:hypothetical protein